MRKQAILSRQADVMTVSGAPCRGFTVTERLGAGLSTGVVRVSKVGILSSACRGRQRVCVEWICWYVSLHYLCQQS